MCKYPYISVFLSKYYESTHGSLKSRHYECTDIRTDKTAMAEGINAQKSKAEKSSNKLQGQGVHKTRKSCGYHMCKLPISMSAVDQGRLSIIPREIHAVTKKSKERGEMDPFRPSHSRG